MGFGVVGAIVQSTHVPGPGSSYCSVMDTVGLLADCGGSRLLDVQWRTDHLATLGVVEVPRREYLARLGDALLLPPCLGQA